MRGLILVFAAIGTTIRYAFFATIWYAAFCIIRRYEHDFGKKKRKLFDFNPKPNKEDEEDKP